MAILFDLDGVFYQADKVIAGAAEVACWANDNSIPHLFLTNTSSKPRSALVERLAGFGIDTDEAHILTPPVAAVRWLRNNLVDEKIALFVPEKTKVEFSDFKDVQQDEEVAAVVVGDLGSDWNFAILNRAFQLLMSEPKPKLVALGMTRYWQADDGLRLDVAPFVMALSHAADVEPLVMGKPALSFYKAAVDILGEDASRIVMVGDDVCGDVDGAQRAGLKAVLVRTGKFRESDLETGIKPEAVLDSIVDFPAWYQSKKI
ncbi:MAG: TIGR01458 family HAD-type hydrolase [Gammaproteobacteria bacterium]|nr:TIGR01458 family HAD-type hydrolase [Gammaproteobacteria bacterium]MCW8924523.1 TIGR01458 family HAD-type hydrolase [Gammaproteobacteria bacterium]